MHAPAGTLDYTFDRSTGYTATVTLVGQVIALHGTRIARELARPRPDRTAIAALESARATAVGVCRTLNTADASTLEEIRATYTELFEELLAATCHRAPREPAGA
jgi:hypothetical protein